MMRACTLSSPLTSSDPDPTTAPLTLPLPSSTQRSLPLNRSWCVRYSCSTYKASSTTSMLNAYATSSPSLGFPHPYATGYDHSSPTVGSVFRSTPSSPTPPLSPTAFPRAPPSPLSCLPSTRHHSSSPYNRLSDAISTCTWTTGLSSPPDARVDTLLPWPPKAWSTCQAGLPETASGLPLKRRNSYPSPLVNGLQTSSAPLSLT